MGEGVVHRLADALGLELVEVGHDRAAPSVPGHDGVVEAGVPGGHGLLGVALRATMVRWRSASATSLAWTMPPMPSLMTWR